MPGKSTNITLCKCWEGLNVECTFLTGKDGMNAEGIVILSACHEYSSHTEVWWTGELHRDRGHYVVTSYMHYTLQQICKENDVDSL